MPLDARDELEKLVSYDTRNDNKEKKPTPECPTYINSKLEALGFRTELLESNGFYTAFGRKGQGKFKILFIAHFDVVPVGDGWKTDPFKLQVEGDKAYGRGTCDDKGNIISMLLLAEKLQESEPDCSVMMAATGDEEIGGRNGAGYLKEYLIKNGLFPHYVVVADGLHQEIIHRRRNTLPTTIKIKRRLEKGRGRKETINLTTETYGTTSRHSAYMRPGVDRHAMLTASKYLDLHSEALVQDVRGGFLKSNVVPDRIELDVVHPDASGDEYEFDRNLTDIMRSLLSLSSLAFPTRPSDKGTMIYPNVLTLDGDLWTLTIDIRAMTNDGDSVQQAFEAALAEVDVFSIKVATGIGFVDVDPNSRFIRAAKWALEKEGISYRVIEGFGASDSRFFAEKGVQLFDFGPEGGSLHGPNEWVSITSIEENAEFFHTLIEVLIREPAPL